MAPPAAAVGADPQAEQERIDQKVAQAAATLELATERAQEAAARFAAADAALPGAEARMAAARGELAAAQARADSAERKAVDAEQELSAAADLVDESSAAVTRARDRVATFAVGAYKGGRLAGFRLMLRAEGPAQAAERLGYLDHITNVERAALDNLSGARLRARHAENRATVSYTRAEDARLDAVAAVSTTAAAETAATAAAEEARSLAETREDALAIAEAEREESLARYQEAEREAELVEAEVREWQARQAAGSAPPAPAVAAAGDSSAIFGMPTKGSLSSPFGMRHDPFYGGKRLHAGMDIAAPGGAPIHAAAEGTVIRAGWNGGYGNFTCLNHGTYQGKGLSTCYAHQSEILVSPGGSVQRGDVIGRVGTTGASTGNHLHFEVRLDGSPADPSGYLPGCLC